jgi:hypothetical protein
LVVKKSKLKYGPTSGTKKPHAPSAMISAPSGIAAGVQRR